MNPENLSRVEEISFELNGINADIDCLEDFYMNGEYKAKIDFDHGPTFYRLYLEKDDILALLNSKRLRHDNLMKELEEL